MIMYFYILCILWINWVNREQTSSVPTKSQSLLHHTHLPCTSRLHLSTPVPSLLLLFASPLNPFTPGPPLLHSFVCHLTSSYDHQSPLSVSYYLIPSNPLRHIISLSHFSVSGLAPLFHIGLPVRHSSSPFVFITTSIPTSPSIFLTDPVSTSRLGYHHSPSFFLTQSTHLLPTTHRRHSQFYIPPPSTPNLLLFSSIHSTFLPHVTPLLSTSLHVPHANLPLSFQLSVCL